MPDVCLSFVLLFTIFITVVTQKLVLQQSKNVTAKCTETLSPPPSIQYLLDRIILLFTLKTNRTAKITNPYGVVVGGVAALMVLELLPAGVWSAPRTLE